VGDSYAGSALNPPIEGADTRRMTRERRGQARLGSRRRRWGAPLVARLLVVAIVPIAAMAFIGSGELRAEQRTVATAESIAVLTQLERDVAAVSAPAYIEYLAHVGLATIDQFGVGRSAVSELTGIDYEGIYLGNADRLDVVLHAIETTHGGVALGDGRTLGTEVVLIEHELAELRLQTAAHVGDRAPADDLFERLKVVLADAVTTTRRQFDTQVVPAELRRFRAESLALGWTLGTAGATAEAVLDTVTMAGAHLIPVTTALAQHRQAVAQLADLLSRDETAIFAALVSTMPDPLDDVPAEHLSLDQFDVERAIVFSNHIIDEIAYLRALSGWADGYYESVATRIALQADAARASLREVTILLVCVLAVVLVAVVMVAQSLLRPVLRLGRRAGELAQGELDLEPLPIRGPRDMRDLTRTINAMQETLLTVDRQAAALAGGRLHDPVLVHSSPGRLGESIRCSVARLTEVTGRLQVSEERSSAIVSHAAVAIWTVDEQGRVVSANAAAERTLGRPEADQERRRLVSSIDSLVGEHEIVRPDGTHVWLDVDHSVVETGGGRLRTVIGEDITERKEFEGRLAHQARHDTLTGLPNRFAVLERLARLADDSSTRGAGPAYGRPIAVVLFIDVDGFKSVNDTGGHAVGDRVLAEIAQRLRAEVRTGSMVARLGGDEFVLIASDLVDAAAAVSLGRRLIERIEQPFQSADLLFAISASVGVAAMMPGDSPLDVLHRADSAVYHAKNLGRARVEVFDLEFQTRVEHRAAMEVAMRDAIATGELEMHLQPIFDLTTGKPVGAEALARWCRPGTGYVMPAEFVAVAESSSLIIELTRSMLNAACDRIARWRLADPTCELRISVKLSGRHIVQGDLIADLVEALSVSGADPRMLELELTETQLLADIEPARATLATIRAMGVTVAVDDFGSGFSSMANLRHLEVDVIKVDRSFVAGAGLDGFDATVIDAMVSFGRALGVHVVAEGVETHDQLDFVRSHGCTRAQGFLLGRPLPPDETERVLGIAPPPDPGHALTTPPTVAAYAGRVD